MNDHTQVFIRLHPIKLVAVDGICFQWCHIYPFVGDNHCFAFSNVQCLRGEGISNVVDVDDEQ